MCIRDSLCSFNKLVIILLRSESTSPSPKKLCKIFLGCSLISVDHVGSFRILNINHVRFLQEILQDPFRIPFDLLGYWTNPVRFLQDLMDDTTRWEVFKLYFEFAWHHFVSRILNISLIFWLFPTKSTKYCYWFRPVSYTHLRAHETDSYLVCRLLLEKKK